MKWFGRKAAPPGARPFLLRYGQAADGAWPRSYEAQVREAYLGNPVAQRAVRLVAEGVGGAPVYALDESAGDGPPPPRFARSPSPFRGGLVTPSLLESVAAHLLLHGNAFVQLLCDGDGVPAELFALRPERVRVEADAGGWPAAYVYRAGASEARIAARDGLRRPQILHVKALHPLDDHYGLGCLGAAAGAVAIHNAATRWNKALLDNAARPSGALVFEPGDGAALSAEQYQRLQTEMETAFQGAANAGRPMLLEGGLKWQAMSLTPADMDFVGLKAAAAREIALAFGVPPMLLGLPGDATYANYREDYLRKGSEAGVEVKAMVGASGAAGGYAVPHEIDAAIERALASISPIRAIANVVKVGSAGYRKLVTTGGTPSGWVAEDAGRPETDTPDFVEIAPPFGELYANPAASQAMLDDAAFDVEAWLASEIATEFARAEGAAFVGGSGVNRPKGFLAAPNSAQNDGVRPFGTLQYVASGAAGGFAASNPQDRLIDLVQALRPPYRQGAVFVMNSATASAIRKFKTADGAFLWQPGLVTGQPDTLLGYPLVEAEDMPDIAANSLSIAFGNFKAGYLIAERSETQILRDPYTNKPFVHFYATKRVGGQVANSEAIKLMKFAA